MDNDPNFSFLDLIDFSIKLGAYRIASEKLYPRSKETLSEARKEFYFSVRHVFLKFLPLVDPEGISKNFTPEEQIAIAHSKLPPKWNVHHQRSLGWGGLSFNPDLLPQIQSTPLTQEQTIICQRYPQHSKNFILRFQLNNFLEQAQKKGVLESCFKKLFKGYLIVLPRELHEKLEKEFIEIQKSNLPPKPEGQSNTNLPPSFPLNYPVWDQLIWGGKHLERTSCEEKDKFTDSKERKKAYKRRRRKQKEDVNMTIKLKNFRPDKSF